MSFERLHVTPFAVTPAAPPKGVPDPPQGKEPPPKDAPPTPAVQPNNDTVVPNPAKRLQLPRLDAWTAAAGEKETTARLGRLPPGLEFSDGFEEPMRYDPGRRVLVYRGFMMSGSYSDLRRLSTDPGYLAALDELYIGSSLPAGAGRGWLVVLALAGVAVLAGAWWLLR